ncbi:MAG: FtsX-like permease family protein [Bacteroidota bacterium]
MSGSHQPPRWVLGFLAVLCRSDVLEEIEGDLLEFYDEWTKDGKRGSDLLFVWHALKFLRPHTLKRPFYHSKRSYMLRNHITVSLRQIIRAKGYAALNVLSLTLGMVAFILIQLWVGFEWSVDSFHEKKSRLYSVYYTAKGVDAPIGGYRIPWGYKSPTWNFKEDFTDQLMASLPGIAKATEYQALYELPWGYPHTFQLGEKIHKIKGSLVEEDLLDMFSVKILAGQQVGALTKATDIVISERMSNLFFDSPAAAVGKTLRYENRKDLVVTAVFEDLPSNSSLQFDYLLSWKLLHTGEVYNASGTSMIFLLLEEAASVAQIEPLFKNFLHERLVGHVEEEVNLGLIPFDEMHLHSDFVNGVPEGGRVEYLNLFTWVGIFILALATFNFSGLATARSVRRSKEIGIRKAIGSSRSQLVGQFLVESVLLSLIAISFSLVIVQLMLPILNTALDLKLSFPYGETSFWLMIAGITICTGVLSGAYPALYLAFQHINKMLRKEFKLSPGAVRFQKGLVLFQSFVTTSMLLWTIVVYHQTQYVRNSDLGYDREGIIYISVEGELTTKYLLFKEELTKMPGIAQVDRSSEAPHEMKFEVADAINWQGKEPGQQVGFFPTSVGFDYLEMMDLQVAEGRGFSRSVTTDTAAFMINKVAAKQIGMEDPVGKWISAWDKRGQIIGVLEDYHINSLHEPIRPLIVDVKEDLYFGNILIKTRPGQMADAIRSTELVAKQINPNYAVDIKFLDVEYGKMYKSELIASKLGSGFTLIAIMISCLGLLGLAVVAAEQRRKEMGVRKVLGASLVDLIGIFTKKFVVLVSIASLIALPVTYLFLRDWLQGFAYHIALSWLHFFAVLFASLVLAFLSISIQALKTARLDPVDTLKLE